MASLEVGKVQIYTGDGKGKVYNSRLKSKGKLYNNRLKSRHIL